ncbi:Fps [Tolypothrix sp. PCC 7601]|nr:Fps [Tolypothrix sp. PCC 7601]
MLTGGGKVKGKRVKALNPSPLTFSLYPIDTCQYLCVELVV